MQIPRVAVFKPAESINNTFASLFNYHEYSQRIVNSATDIIDLVHDETQEFDVIIIPTTLANNLSAISACIQCRAESVLQAVPILVALSHSENFEALAGLYGAGADVVMQGDIQAESFYQQVCALARLHKMNRERINKQLHTAGVSHPVVQAFDSMRDGFLLFDTELDLVFTNVNAKNMLGVQSDQIPETVVRQFLPWIKEHLAEHQLSEAENPAKFMSTTELDLLRTDGRTFSTSITISSIIEDSGKIVGHALFLTDLGEIHHLGNLLLQAQRTRSLCLLATSACQLLIGDMLGGTLLAPYRMIQQYLEAKPKQANLESVVADLVETLDLLVNPDIALKINLVEDCTLAISASDLYILLGQLVLHAIEHAGISGEVSIQSMPVELSGWCSVIVASQTRRQSSFASKDKIGRLINHDINSLASVEDLSDKTSIGLHVAQNIAETYQTTIDFQNSEDTTIKLRVRLPIRNK